MSMARKLDRLTALQVQRKKIGRYPDGNNLYLHVTEDGRYWFFRWDVAVQNPHGLIVYRPRYMSLGPTHNLTLKQARERAQDLRAQRLAGDDPKVQREAKRAATKIAAGHTFANVRSCTSRATKPVWRNVPPMNCADC
jgi:hypothetical protein